MRITQDPLSRSFLALSVLIMLYFIFVLNLMNILIYPMLLLLGAVVFRVFLNKKLEVDEYLDEVEKKSMLIYYIFALLGIGLGSFLVRGLYRFPIENYLNILSISPLDTVLFSTLMAITEEQFFRGELLEWQAGHMPPYVSILTNGLIFAGYHLGVYGTNMDNLMYVLVGGITLAWVVFSSRRLFPATAAHVTNNLGGLF